MLNVLKIFKRQGLFYQHYNTSFRVDLMLYESEFSAIFALHMFLLIGFLVQQAQYFSLLLTVFLFS